MTTSGSTPRSLEELSASLYDRLRSIAERNLARGPNEAVDATDVVHECYLKLARLDDYRALRREDFLALAATLIRNLLVDRRRHEQALKRGGGRWERVTLSEAEGVGKGPDLDLLALHEALDRLAERDPRQARIVELRFFGGMNGDEVARVLGVTRKTVVKEWTMARAWLRREMRGGSS